MYLTLSTDTGTPSGHDEQTVVRGRVCGPWVRVPRVRRGDTAQHAGAGRRVPRRGGAVQVEPMKPTLKAPGTKRFETNI